MTRLSEERLAEIREWGARDGNLASGRMCGELLGHIDAVEAELAAVTEAGLRLAEKLREFGEEVDKARTEMASLLEQVRILVGQR